MENSCTPQSEVHFVFVLTNLLQNDIITSKYYDIKVNKTEVITYEKIMFPY